MSFFQEVFDFDFDSELIDDSGIKSISADQGFRPLYPEEYCPFCEGGYGEEIQEL